MNNSNHISSKIRRRLRWVMNDFLFGAGLKTFHPPEIPVQRILVYHGIDRFGNTKYNSRFLSREIFETQLLFFKDHFHIISLDDFYKKNFHDKRSTIAITFDDGYANNNYYALPLLKKHEVPATFFITTIRDAGYEILWTDALDLSSAMSDKPFELQGERFVKKGKKGYWSEKTGLPLKETCKNYGFDYKIELMKKLPGLEDIIGDKEFNDYWKLLNEEKLKELAACPLVTIGAHGYSHNCLERIPIADAQREMYLSKNYLEKIIDKNVDALAFPDGNYSEAVIQSALQIGYTKLLAGDLAQGDAEDDILKSRFTINPHISLFNQAQAIVKGNYF
jgi:peptidoglycan/xylan/chitin deacetylase (PgdA/CDA1 family)